MEKGEDYEKRMIEGFTQQLKIRRVIEVFRKNRDLEE